MCVFVCVCVSVCLCVKSVRYGTFPASHFFGNLKWANIFYEILIKYLLYFARFLFLITAKRTCVHVITNYHNHHHRYYQRHQRRLFILFDYQNNPYDCISVLFSTMSAFAFYDANYIRKRRRSNCTTYSSTLYRTRIALLNSHFIDFHTSKNKYKSHTPLWTSLTAGYTNKRKLFNLA